jgi:hypothetical protein
LRQVPDNQEVFLYPDSDISVVAEILKSVEPSDLSEAIKSDLQPSCLLVAHCVYRFHFDSLAHDNDAKVSTVLATERIANVDNELITILRGEQLVPKFNMVEPDLVHIFMALLRVEAKNIDIVVTFNVPVKSAGGGAVGEEALKLAEKDFDSFVHSLRIIDFGLFS